MALFQAGAVGQENHLGVKFFKESNTKDLTLFFQHYRMGF